jgi:dTDP-4-dehydrorhamnose reductase
MRAALDDESTVRATSELATLLAGCEAVVNAAGLATPTGSGDDLFGADALLPGVLARAVGDSVRLVHVSSAAVQGRRPVLDETSTREPFSPYSSAKALGEELLLSQRPASTCFRATSVHGRGRSVTASLVRLAGSPLASVAGAGDGPTPQVLVENVGDAVAYLALCEEQPPAIVLQPSEGMTTADLVRVLGGREPRRVPVRLARGLVAGGHLVGARVPAVAGMTRRVEMLWFGQRQSPGWLDARWTPVAGPEKWKDLT